VWSDDSTESRAELDQHIRKLGPMSPTRSKHELYRSIQKGGNIPEHGLQLSAANDRKGISFQFVFEYSDMIMGLYVCICVYVPAIFTLHLLSL